MAGIDKIISSLQLEQQERTAKATALSLGLDYVNLLGYPIIAEVLQIITAQEASEFEAVAFLRSKNELKVAVSVPPTEAHNRFFAKLAQEKELIVKLSYCSKMSYSYAMSLYTKFEQEKQRRQKQRSIRQGDRFIATIKNIRDIGTHLQKVSTTQLVELLFTGAVVTDASDIHLEPTQDNVRLRFRIDGILQDVGTLTKEQFHSVSSRIKNMSHLKLDLSGAPQDGRLSTKAGGHNIDVRVSILPATFGEDIVMRILVQDAKFLTIKELNINPKSLEEIKKAIEQPHGMILNTGPTGSGKTTTLYAILSELNEPTRKIITIEDPVEYRIPGINQIQVNRAANLTFASTLRSVLRQDPDIIMVGEIRDPKTAQVALQAALTGHLVLSTLHANSAPAAIPRLLEMGIEPYLLAGSINLIISQRLVRQLCSACKGNDKNCPECAGTGYKGRLPIIETLIPTQEFNELISRKATIAEFEQKAKELGMQTILEDGMAKVAAGLTTKEEVERVSRELKG